MKYLLDTNTVSRIVRKNSPKLIEKLKQVEIPALAISVLTEAELLYGLARKPGCHPTGEGRSRFPPSRRDVGMTSDTAGVYASLRLRTESQGIGIGVMDLLIAAHAMERGRVLVTNDSGLKQLGQLLNVEDWV